MPTATGESRKTICRADAVVSLVGLPVFRGPMSARDSRRCANGKTRGLNRLGYIEEVVVERDGAADESAYFGFITANTEETVEQAKKTLTATGPTISYTAADAHSAAGSTRSVLAKLTVPSSFTWAHFAPLSSFIRERFSAAVAETREAAAAPRTFLYAIRSVLRDPANHVETGYFYTGNPYKMRVDRNRASSGQIRYRGEIRNLSTNKTTPFKFYAAPGASMPHRIEMQVRSYLKLAFEADSTAADPSA